jgi:hypothetical protein
MYTDDDIMRCCCDRYLCYGCRDNCDYCDDSQDGLGLYVRYYDKRTREYLDKNGGDLLASIRPFGVEIEAYYADIDDLAAVAAGAPHTLGIAADGSLGERGVEFQTPRLAGGKGQQYVEHVCRLLNENSFSVSRACGMHIHIDGEGYKRVRDYQRLKTLWQFYIAFEDAVLALLPQSRRGNRFCNALKPLYHIEEIRRADSRKALEKIWYRVGNMRFLGREKKEVCHSTRYRGLNLHSLFHDGHFEIRYHSGTINVAKILHWVSLHTSIIDRVGRDDIADERIREALYLPSYEEKLSLLFELAAVPKATAHFFIQRAKALNPQALVSPFGRATTLCAA